MRLLNADTGVHSHVGSLHALDSQTPHTLSGTLGETTDSISRALLTHRSTTFTLKFLGVCRPLTSHCGFLRTTWCDPSCFQSAYVSILCFYVLILAVFRFICSLLLVILCLSGCVSQSLQALSHEDLSPLCFCASVPTCLWFCLRICMPVRACDHLCALFPINESGDLIKK